MKTKEELLQAFKDNIILDGAEKTTDDGRTWYAVLVEGRHIWLTNSMAAEDDSDNPGFELSL